MIKLFQWLFAAFVRDAVIKFVVFSAIIGVVSFLVPKVVSALAGFISPSALTSAFAAIPSGVWYFLDFFRLDFGFPLCLAASVSRFLIRRLPFIG